MINLIQLITLLLFFSGFSQSILDKDLVKYEGFFDFYYDIKSDKIYLEVENLNSDFLYISSLATGIGSNDIGLDRGQLGSERLVSFQKSGNKIDDSQEEIYNMIQQIDEHNLAQFKRFQQTGNQKAIDNVHKYYKQPDWSGFKY